MEPVPSLDWLAVPCPVHPGVRSAILAARACCWLTCNSRSTQAPDPFPWGSSLSSPSLYVYPGLSSLRYRIWHLALLNFTQLVTAQHCNLSGTLCKTSLSSMKSTDPSNLVLFVNVILFISATLLGPHQ